MNWIKVTSMYVLAIFMIVAGTMHFVSPEFFLKIMPPYLPLHKELVAVSGVCEILLGVLLLIAVFPANVYLYQHQEILPASPIIHLLRLPLQGALILWAYWHTGSAETEP